MCRMFGAVCNDEDLLTCAISEVQDALRLERDERHDGIGVGYYRSDDPLLRKRPCDVLTQIDYNSLVDGISSNTVLVHIRMATVGAWKDANTHPFRFRRWLFAHVGHLSHLHEKRDEVSKDLPPFLSRNLRGETDSELAFHVFLNCLFKDGTLNDLSLNVEQLAVYLRESAELIEGPSDTKSPSTFAIIVTNGQIMGSICRGVPMHYSLREGIHQCLCKEKSEQNAQSHQRFKGVMLGAEMSNPGHQWREVTDGSLLTVSKELELKVQPI